MVYSLLSENLPEKEPDHFLHTHNSLSSLTRSHLHLSPASLTCPPLRVCYQTRYLLPLKRVAVSPSLSLSLSFSLVGCFHQNSRHCAATITSSQLHPTQQHIARTGRRHCATLIAPLHFSSCGNDNGNGAHKDKKCGKRSIQEEYHGMKQSTNTYNCCFICIHTRNCYQL
jgi:hypothetical protein